MLRKVEISDSIEISRVVNLAYRSYGGWTTEAHLIEGERVLEEEVEMMIRKEKNRMIVLEDESEIVGTVYIERNEEKGRGEIGMFSVNPERQGQGYGKRILAEAERVIRDEMGLKHSCLFVIHKRTDLLDFYQRRNYQISPEKIPFQSSNINREKVIIQDSLYFNILLKEL